MDIAQPEHDATFAAAGVTVDAPGVDQMRATHPPKTEKHPKPYAHRYNIAQAMQYTNDAAGYHLLNWINSTIYSTWQETALSFAEPSPFAYWHNAVLTSPTPLGLLALDSLRQHGVIGSNVWCFAENHLIKYAANGPQICHHGVVLFPH